MPAVPRPSEPGLSGHPSGQRGVGASGSCGARLASSPTSERLPVLGRSRCCCDPASRWRGGGGCCPYLHAPCAAGGRRRGGREPAPGIQDAWVPRAGFPSFPPTPRALWAVPGLELGRWVRSKPPSPAASLFFAFIRRERGEEGGPPWFSAARPPGRSSHLGLARLRSFPKPDPSGALFSNGGPGWSQGGAPLPPHSTRAARCPAASAGAVPARLAPGQRSIGGCCAD